jgi:hypothetical protein
MMRTLVIGVSSVFLCSCASVIWVKQKPSGSNDKPTDLPGVPFYVKTQQFKQTSVYNKTWLRATLTVEKKWRDRKTGKDTERGKESFARDVAKASSTNPLENLRTAILKSNNTSVDAALRLVESFTKIDSVKEADVPAVLVKNSIESEWVVDAGNTYYLNAPLPWFGTGNLSQELNSDGTLSKASSNPDTKLAEGISALLPLKEFLTGEFVKPGKDATSDSSTKNDAVGSFLASMAKRPGAKVEEGDFVYVLSLDVTEVGHEYTLMRPPQHQKPAVAAIPFSAIASDEAMFEMKDLGSDKEDKGDDKDTPKIGISGSITLPKPDAAAKSDGQK